MFSVTEKSTRIRRLLCQPVMALHLLLLETLVFRFPFFWGGGGGGGGGLKHDALFLEARFQQFVIFRHLLHSRQTNRGAPSLQSNTKN